MTPCLPPPLLPRPPCPPPSLSGSQARYGSVCPPLSFGGWVVVSSTEKINRTRPARGGPIGPVNALPPLSPRPRRASVSGWRKDTKKSLLSSTEDDPGGEGGSNRLEEPPGALQTPLHRRSTPPPHPPRRHCRTQPQRGGKPRWILFFGCSVLVVAMQDISAPFTAPLATHSPPHPPGPSPPAVATPSAAISHVVEPAANLEPRPQAASSSGRWGDKGGPGRPLRGCSWTKQARPGPSRARASKIRPGRARPPLRCEER